MDRFEQLTIHVKSRIPGGAFQGISVLGLGIDTLQPLEGTRLVEILSNGQYVGWLTGSWDVKVIDLAGAMAVPQFALHPRNSVSVTKSDLVLQRAQLGMSSIDVGLNALGLRDDYVPAFRFNYLREHAETALAKAKEAGTEYFNAKQVLEKTVDAQEAQEYAVAVAESNVVLGQTMVKIAQTGQEIADGRIVATQNQIQALEEEKDDVEHMGSVNTTAAVLGGFLPSLSGNASPDQNGEMSYGGGISINPLGGILGVWQAEENTQVMLNNIERRQEQLQDEKKLAEMEAERAALEVEAQQQRNRIAEMERGFQKALLARASGENFTNPEIWYQTMVIQRRLFFAALERAIFACWRVQKCTEFEIEIGSDPLIDGMTVVSWKPIRFDYLDTVPVDANGDYLDGYGKASYLNESGDLVINGPLIAAMTGPGRLQDDFDNIVLFRELWYEQNTDRFSIVDLDLRTLFPLQMAQIRAGACDPHTPNTVRVHFHLGIKVFDEQPAGRPVYGRLFSVRAFWDAPSLSDTSAFAGELYNTYLLRDGTASSLSYWRVPYDANLPPELWRNDWIDDSTAGERWVLKAKPAVPNLSDSSVQLYLLGSTIGDEVYNLNNEHYFTFLNTFENTGLECDWTLDVRKPTSSQANWSEISNVKLRIVWKASGDQTVTNLINTQATWGIRGRTRGWSLRELPQWQLFGQVFHPNCHYTDDPAGPGAIPFQTLDSQLPGNSRQMKAIYLIFCFDPAVTPLTSAPSLAARLTKDGVVDTSGQQVEITFTSPTATVQPEFHLPPEFLDKDPVGTWTFKMLCGDNTDPNTSQLKSLSGLQDIYMVIEYNYT